MIERMDGERKELTASIHDIMWHMRGSLSREEAWTLCLTERRLIEQDIKKRVELTQTSGMPLL